MAARAAQGFSGRSAGARFSIRRRRSDSCCGAGDVVDTKFKVEPGDEKHPQDTWYAMLKSKWVRIPPTKIIPDFAPDGKAYLFVLKSYDPHGNDYDEKIVCFVRPNGGN